MCVRQATDTGTKEEGQVTKHHWTVDVAARLTTQQARWLANGHEVRVAIATTQERIYCRRCWTTFSEERADEACGPAGVRR